MTFIHARGPKMEESAIPSSAFSKGDLLMYDSNSSLSRFQDPIVTVGLLVGVALADSIESLDDQVPYALAVPGSVWLSTATVASQMTPGAKLDVEYTGSVFRVTSSATTPIVTISPGGGTEQIRGQSNISRVLVQFDIDETIWST